MKKTLFVLALAIVMVLSMSALALAGGGQVKANTPYTMVNVKYDGWETSSKTATYTAQYGAYYGYTVIPYDGASFSILVDGSINYTSCALSKVTIVWSKDAPAAPTVTFTEDANGAITGATVVARVTEVRVPIKSKCHKKHFKTIKVYTRLWAPDPAGTNQARG